MKKILVVGLLMGMFVNSAFAFDKDEYTSKMTNIHKVYPTHLSRHMSPSSDMGEMLTDAAIDAAAMPTAVSIASATGVTASTGTAISSLSGAAATSATAAAVGSSVIEGAAAIGIGITAAPAAVGVAVIGGVAAGVSWLVHKLF